jgi:hypothetical protein
MRREDLTLAVRDPEAGDEFDGPTLVVEFDGAPEALSTRLRGPDEEPLADDQTDVSFRFTTPVEAEDPTGVLGVTDRLTGDFLMEVNAGAGEILSFVREARRHGERDDTDGTYRIRVRADGQAVATYEKSTFLVYNRDGDLLRDYSLIPGGVEL